MLESTSHRFKSAVLLYTHCFYHCLQCFLTALSSVYSILYHQYILFHIISTYMLFLYQQYIYFVLFPILCKGIHLTFILLACQSSSTYHLMSVMNAYVNANDFTC